MKIQLNVSDYDQPDIEERIIERAATTLANRVENKVKDEVRQQLNKTIIEKADQIIGKMVDDLLKEGIPHTDSYGRPINGGLQSVKDIFINRISGDHYSNIERYISAGLSKLAKSEVDEELAAIRKQVQEGWTNKVKTLIKRNIAKISEDLPF